MSRGGSMRKLLSALFGGLWRGLHGRYGLAPTCDLRARDARRAD